MRAAPLEPLFYRVRYGMKRRDIIKVITSQDGLIVSNLGFPSRELYAIADKPENFYMLGSMGLASSVGLGLALSQHKRVFVIDGDGSVLMNMGSLATIAHHAPDNFCLIIVDNTSYGSTGSQPSYTAQKTDLAAVAKGAGNKHVVRVKTVSGLRKTLKRYAGNSIVVIAETERGNETVPVIPYQPVEIKQRFMGVIRHEEMDAIL